MKRRAIVVLVACVAWLAPVALAAAAHAGEYTWTDVPRVVAVGDVHGSFDPLVELLQATRLIDAERRWIGGTDHLVLVGDLVDRGARDRDVLDMMRGLQEQAEAAGGRVHLLLGNHEVMNLVRDLRYVHPGSFAAFAGEETERERRSGLKRFKRSWNGPKEELQAAFDERFPPGYFARVAAFDPTGEYGSWLLGWPAVVMINGVVFVHGGLTEHVAEYGIDGINGRIHGALEEHLRARRQLEVRAVVDSTMTFGQAQRAAYAFWQRNQFRGGTLDFAAAAQLFGRLADSPLFGTEGPLWYRGNALEDERVERDRFDRTLAALGARALVVAHSPTGEMRITSRFFGRLYRIDHGMYDGGTPQALVLQNGDALVFDPSKQDLAPPPPEPPQGERTDFGRGALDDEAVARVLASGEILAMRELGRGSTRPRLLEIEGAGVVLRGLYKSIDEPGDRYRNELAAYAIDRMLGTALVPVTVERSLDGVPGSVQEWVEGAVDGEALERYDIDPVDSDALARGLAATRVFDYLIGNDDRSPRDVLYSVAWGELRLVDHSKAFPATVGDVDAAELPQPPPPGLIEALRGLDHETLGRELGGFLHAAQVDAALARRDRLLQVYGGEARRRGAGLRPLSAAYVRADAGPDVAPPPAPRAWPDEGKERFLRDAEVVASKFIGTGVTRPKKLTLRRDGVQLSAAFKYVDEFRPGITRFNDGPVELNFRDSYLFDRAAYLLDRELGLGMVPATVLREVDGTPGAVVWWIDDAISEADRLQRAISPARPAQLRVQQDAARVFYALVENTDDNMSNQLITLSDWRVHLIDLTRAFRVSRDVPGEFVDRRLLLPRDLLPRLRALQEDRLLTTMDGLLSKVQVRALLSRRDAIVAKIQADLARYGEDEVFWDGEDDAR